MLGELTGGVANGAFARVDGQRQAPLMGSESVNYSLGRMDLFLDRGALMARLAHDARPS